MSTGIVLIAALVVIAGVFVGWLLRGYLKQRGERVITCPETLTHEAVQVDAGHAAVSGLMGHTELRLSDCTRWPGRQSCGQECLSQINAAPDGCLISSTVAHWYAGKTCALCGRAVGDREWLEHEPALVDPDDPTHKTLTWRDVRPERVLEVLATHRPVCWNCHVSETFRRQRPDLVIERPPYEANAHEPRH